MNSLLPSPSRVLPTLNADGTRRRIRPKAVSGKWQRRRALLAYGLILTFVSLPFVEMSGKPVILLDVAAREFTFFGHTFLPTEGVLLMLLLLTIFVGIFWMTALVGRAWCGWACPQTVYMEFVFRPIERLFEGDRNAQLKLDKGGPTFRRIAKNVVFALMAIVVANVFLAYFVGVDALQTWVSRSPFEHPTPFLVMAVTSALAFYDFAFFREQMCTVVCPYARLQSALLDRRSLVVGYDSKRGEPRAKGKPAPNKGDCVDCSACVNVCPMGIDIRDGLQLECVACALCVDACDDIMTRVRKPVGLIRYGSQESLQSPRLPSVAPASLRPTSSRMLRPRVIVYPVLLAGLLAALVGLARSRTSAELTILRGIGAPFVDDGDTVRNQIRIKIRNRSGHDQAYRISLVSAPDLQLIAPENPLRVASGAHETTTVFVFSPRRAFVGGERQVVFQVSDGHAFDQQSRYKLLGPATTTTAGQRDDSLAPEGKNDD